MIVWELIDSVITRKQLPYVSSLTIFVKDGYANAICLTRFDGKNIAKKASKVGLPDVRNMKKLNEPIKLNNIYSHDIQQGSYYCIYDTVSKEITIYRS